MTIKKPSQRRKHRKHRKHPPLTEFPELISEWHLTLNVEFGPQDFTAGSGKSVYWQCKKDTNHVWPAKICNRALLGSGCPYCTGKRADSSNSLSAKFPDIAKEWHPDRNGDIKPTGVTYGSKKIVWWRCNKGHEWQARPNDRTSGYGCPECGFERGGVKRREASVRKHGSIAETSSELVKEWHPSKNQDLSPSDFSKFSKKKVWWICRFGHEWPAAISNRAQNGTGCPRCCNRQTSKPEIRKYTELRSVFKNVEWRETRHGYEMDIYLPDYCLGVEVDGGFWHADKAGQDIQKAKDLALNGIDLVRVRDDALPQISPDDILYNDPRGLKFSHLKRLCSLISSRVSLQPAQADRFKRYLKRRKFAATKEFDEIVSRLPGPPEDKAFAKLHPKIAIEWDTTKNEPYSPWMFSPGSHHPAWWKCRGCHNEWRAQIKSRASGQGCPKCGQMRGAKKLSITLAKKLGTLAEKRPDLAAQWDFEANGELTPDIVAEKGGKRVGWVCPKGHRWNAVIRDRTRSPGCPVCRAKSKTLKPT